MRYSQIIVFEPFIFNTPCEANADKDPSELFLNNEIELLKTGNKLYNFFQTLAHFSAKVAGIYGNKKYKILKFYIKRPKTYTYNLNLFDLFRKLFIS